MNGTHFLVGSGIGTGPTGAKFRSAPSYILVIFGICVLAGIVRVLSRWTFIHHSVVMFLVGCLLGYLAQVYGWFAYLVNVDFMTGSQSGVLRLHAFVMPLIIFHYVFAMDPRVFLSCSFKAVAVVVLDYALTIATQGAFVLFLMSFYTLQTTAVRVALFYVLFAALTSITDTSYVVNTFYKMGSYWVLLKLMQIKRIVSLIGACVIFMFIVYVDEHSYTITWWELAVFAAMQLVASPLLGYVVALITIWWLSQLYNDPAVEISISIAMAYLLYYFGLSFLYSKPMVSEISVMIYALYLNNRRSCFSLGHDRLLYTLLHIAVYVIQTVAFSVMGFCLVNWSSHQNKRLYGTEFLATCCLYSYCMLCRGVVCVATAPLLRRCGYNLSWQELSTMVFCNVTGTICVIFAVSTQHPTFTDFYFNSQRLQYAVLFHIAVLAVLRSMIAGSCFKFVLTVLGMKRVSLSRYVAMTEALQQIQELTRTAARSYRFDRFLADADWDTVYKFTNFDNPYREISRYTVIGSAMSLDAEELDDTRLNLLHAKRKSFWRQYEQGLLSLTALRILIEECNLAECKVTTDGYDFMDRIRKHYQPTSSGKFNVSLFLKKKLEKLQITRQHIVAEILQPIRRAKLWKRALYTFTVRPLLEVILIIAILFICVASVLVLVYEIHCLASWNKILMNVLYYEANLAFMVLFSFYLLLKFCVFKRRYLMLHGSYFNSGLLIVGWIDVGMHSYLMNPEQACATLIATNFVITHRIVFHKLFVAHRLLRILIIFEDKTYFIVRRVTRGLLLHLQLGYDVGKAYVYCKEDVQESLDGIVSHPVLFGDIQKQLHTSRQQLMRELATVQKTHPGIVISVKSQEACRRILNAVYDLVHQMRKNGTVDGYEADMLEEMIKLRTKKLAKIPAQIQLPSVRTLISKLDWVDEDPTLMRFIDFNSNLFNMAEGETVDFDSDTRGGLYVLVSGLIRVTWHIGDPYERLLEAQGVHASTHQVVHFNEQHLDDYMTTGSTFGELALLTEEPVVISAKCETSVLMYHIQYESVRAALDWITDPSLENQLWKLAAVRVSVPLLKALPGNRSTTVEDLKMLADYGTLIVQHMESEYEQKNSNGEQVFNVSRYNNINHVILVHGTAHDGEMLFSGPCIIPPDAEELHFSSITSDSYALYLVPFQRLPMNILRKTSGSEISTVAGRLSLDSLPSNMPRTGAKRKYSKTSGRGSIGLPRMSLQRRRADRRRASEPTKMSYTAVSTIPSSQASETSVDDLTLAAEEVSELVPRSIATAPADTIQEVVGNEVGKQKLEQSTLDTASVVLEYDSPRTISKTIDAHVEEETLAENEPEASPQQQEEAQLLLTSDLTQSHSEESKPVSFELPAGLTSTAHGRLPEVAQGTPPQTTARHWTDFWKLIEPQIQVKLTFGTPRSETEHSNFTETSPKGGERKTGDRSKCDRDANHVNPRSATPVDLDDVKPSLPTDAKSRACACKSIKRSRKK